MDDAVGVVAEEELVTLAEDEDARLEVATLEDALDELEEMAFLP